MNNFTEFSYDGLGRNVKIVETESGSVTATRQFVVINGKKREERNGSDALMKKFFDLGQEDGSTNRFYAENHLGSVCEVTDDNADVESRYTYGPYGDAIRTQGSTDVDFQFSSYFMHARSGLNLTLHRAYASSLGRWLSRDPIHEDGGINMYGYVANKPVRNVDPLGLFWIDPNDPAWNGQCIPPGAVTSSWSTNEARSRTDMNDETAKRDETAQEVRDRHIKEYRRYGPWGVTMELTPGQPFSIAHWHDTKGNEWAQWPGESPYIVIKNAVPVPYSSPSLIPNNINYPIVEYRPVKTAIPVSHPFHSYYPWGGGLGEIGGMLDVPQR